MSKMRLAGGCPVAEAREHTPLVQGLKGMCFRAPSGHFLYLAALPVGDANDE